MSPTYALRRLALPALLAVTVFVALPAEDNHDLRILPQITAGTHGFNVGAAFEWRPEWGGRHASFIVRPEAFINDDFDFGGGASVLWRFRELVRLEERHDVMIGPRVVHHGGDDHGLEIGVLVGWTLDLQLRGTRDRHYAQALFGLGAIEDEDDDDTDFGLSVGAAYAYRF